MPKSKRSKACEISPEVKKVVGDRDHYRCVICRAMGIPNAHYIPRSDGGLGIETNVVTLCFKCHQLYDNGYDKDENLREKMGAKIEKRLKEYYPDWKREDQIYKKYDW